METTPGWYGKLPSTGDFASRRLPHELIEPWDTWLAEELAGLKAQSDNWLSAYLDSPTWRFVVPARWVHAGQAGLLAGVLMPSVDSVGRYFPLSIMAALPEMPTHTGTLEPVLNWLHALDDLAADALQEDWPIDTLEGALARLPVPRPDLLAVSEVSALLSGDRRMVSIPVPDTRQALMGGVGQALLQWVLGSASTPAPDLGWWWCEPHAMVQQRQLLVSTGLPSGADFATLLGSNHNRHAVPAAVTQPPSVVAPNIGPSHADPLSVAGVAFMAGALNPAAADETVPPLGAAATPRPPASADDSDATLPPAPRVPAQAPGVPTEEAPVSAESAETGPDTTASEDDPPPSETDANAQADTPAADANTDTDAEMLATAPLSPEAAAGSDEATIPAITPLAQTDTPEPGLTAEPVSMPEPNPDQDPDQTLPHVDGTP